MQMRQRKAIVTWLYGVIALVYAMVLIGGLTRLTNSGLSMVDWRPIMGALPPLSDAEWHRVFEAYRQFPEYQLVNAGMSLAEFKSIFYWEYGHRLLGRLIGIVFFLPMVFFVMTGAVRGRLLAKLAFAFVLGGSQGLLGWYMVKSGLVLEPRVSHYRLAAHLTLALAIIAYLFWVVRGLNVDRAMRQAMWAPLVLTKTRRLSWLFFVLLCLQTFYGAMVAGLDAGLLYNTFPSWNGLWIPPGLGQLQPAWLNVFENPVTVQFIHRMGGWGLFAYTLYYSLHLRRNFAGHRLGRVAYLLLALITFQFTLGVLTLIWMVPVSLASLHQAGAVALLLTGVYALHSLSLESSLRMTTPAQGHPNAALATESGGLERASR